MNLINISDEVNISDIKVGEAFQGGSFSREEGENQSISINFIITGAVDAYPAYIALINYLRNNYWSDFWSAPASYNLPLQNVSLESMDCNFAYTATCTFKLPNEESNNGSTNKDRQGTSYNNPVINEPTFQMPEVEPNDFTFTVSGAQAHINRAYQSVRYVTSDTVTVTDYQNGINYNGEGFDGVDVIEPQISFSVAISAPSNFMTVPYRNLLIAYTGSVNLYPWADFPKGGVLFKGYTAKPVALNYTDENGESVKDWYWRISYEFDARPSRDIIHPEWEDTSEGRNKKWYNDKGEAVSRFITVEGFQYLWYYSKQQIKNGIKCPLIEQANVCDVYMKNDFSNLDIPGLVSDYQYVRPEYSGSGSGEGSAEDLVYIETNINKDGQFYFVKHGEIYYFYTENLTVDLSSGSFWYDPTLDTYYYIDNGVVTEVIVFM